MRRIKKQLAVLLTLALLFPLAISAASAEEHLTLSEYKVIHVETVEELSEVLQPGESNIEIRLSGKTYDLEYGFWSEGICDANNIRLVGTNGTIIKNPGYPGFRIIESSEIEIRNIEFQSYIQIDQSQNVTIRDCKSKDLTTFAFVSGGSTVKVQNTEIKNCEEIVDNVNSIISFEDCTFKENGPASDDGEDTAGFKITERHQILDFPFLPPMIHFVNCTFENNRFSHFKYEVYSSDAAIYRNALAKTDYNVGYTTMNNGTFINNGWQDSKDSETTPHVQPINVFADVHKADWFYDSVMYVYEADLFGGVTETQFSPNAPMTRAMMATVLHRSTGSSEYELGIAYGFTDVPRGTWYTTAVDWAAIAGIVSGIGDNKFDPDGNVTREQMAVMLYNYAELLGRNLPVERASYAFADNDKISPWAAEAVDAMYRAELLNGYETGNFNPQGNASRAEVATVLMKFLEAMFF